MNANEALTKFAELAWTKVIFIAALVAALFYFVGVDKGVSEQEFANAENQRRQAETTLKKTKEAMADLKKFRSQIDDMNTQFTQMTTYMTANPNFSDFVFALQKLATQSGAIVRSVNPSNKIERTDFYDTTRVSLQLEGRYPQLVGFLSDLSKLRRLITIDNLDLESAQGSDDMKSGRINFKATVVGYRYAPPEVTDPKNPAAAGASNAH